VIFYGGEILTMEGQFGTVQAVAVLGDKIAALGTDDEILALQSPETILVDLGGRTVMPGFVDPHSHVLYARENWGLDLDGAQRVALRAGITTVGIAGADAEFLDEMRAFADGGQLRIRTSLYLLYNNACGEVLGDWYQDHPPTRVPGEMLRIGGVKVFTDGGSCGAPAVSIEHPAYGFGDLWLAQDELNAVLVDIQRSGHQAAIHALGDRAVEQALNAVEFALDGQANTPRHRIEHNAIVRDDMLARYTDIGVIAIIHGSYPICNPEMAPPPEGWQGWEWRWRDLVDHNPGLHFAWHSDMGTTLFAHITPLQHLFSMVTPFEVASDGETTCETASWVADKTLSIQEVLPMMTIDAAYTLFRNDEVGSIYPGKYADLIILSGNPTTVEPEAILDFEVLMTMVGGNVEYCATGHESLCPILTNPMP
jgi:hypothetical protein